MIKKSTTTIIAMIITIGLISPLAALGDGISVPTTPKEIIKAIDVKGLAYVSMEIFNSDVWQKYAYPGISSGDPDWLEVATILKPSLDAGGSEELDDALALALLKRPYTALPILKEIWDGENVCYFAWDSEVPAKSVRDYVNQLEKALSKQANKENAELRSLCLRGIKKTRKELSQNKQ